MNCWRERYINHRSPVHQTCCSESCGTLKPDAGKVSWTLGVMFHARIGDGHKGNDIRIIRLEVNSRSKPKASPKCFCGENWTNWAKFPSSVFVLPGCQLSWLVLGSSLNCWETLQSSPRPLSDTSSLHLLLTGSRNTMSVINHSPVFWHNGLLAMYTQLGHTLCHPCLSQSEDCFLDFWNLA